MLEDIVELIDLQNDEDRLCHFFTGKKNLKIDLVKIDAGFTGLGDPRFKVYYFSSLACRS